MYTMAQTRFHTQLTEEHQRLVADLGAMEAQAQYLTRELAAAQQQMSFDSFLATFRSIADGERQGPAST